MLNGQFTRTNCHKDSLSGRIVTRTVYQDKLKKDKSGIVVTKTDQVELLQGQIRTNCYKDRLSGRIVTRTVYQDELPQGQVIRTNCHKDSLSRRDEYINVKF